MKKDAITAEVNAVLKGLGFTSKQYRWMGPELHVVVGGEFRSLRFPAGTSKREVQFLLGRITGWVDILAERAAAISTPAKAAPVSHKANGHAAPAGVSP